MLAALIFFPIIGAFAVYAVGRVNKKARDITADVVVAGEFVMALICALAMGEGRLDAANVMGYGLHFVLDGFRRVYLVVATFMWMVATVFSGEYFKHYRNRNRYYLFLLFTLGATVGVFLSADLYTLFLFFEMMSFTSYVWVAHDEKAASLRAAQTYLAVAVIGGLVMLMGLFLLYNALGSLEIARLAELAAACPDKRLLYAAGACVSVGFGAKAGAFPLHIWLPKAHPVAPAPASALLSGILTKTGIFGLLIVSCRLFWGDGAWGSVILLLGAVTMFLGAVLALFSVDLKRTLACSSVSQIGFIMVGIGMQGLLGEENALAARGTMLHMVNHSLFKLVLFLVAGVVFMNLHELDLNRIRGFGRRKPLLHAIFLTGALGIAGVPLFSGYISKTLLHEGIVEYTQMLRNGAPEFLFSVAGMQALEWIFLISGGLTAAYMTKLYVAVFVEKNADEKTQARFDGMRRYMSVWSALVLSAAAVLLFVMGMLPRFVMDPVGALGAEFMNAGEHAEAVHYFSLANLKGALVSLAIGAVLYLLVVRPLLMEKREGVRVYVNRWPRHFDLEDAVYRPLLKIAAVVLAVFARVCDCLVDAVIVLLRKTLYADRPLPVELHEGTRLTYCLGTLMNAAAKARGWRRPEAAREQRDYVHELALRHAQAREARGIISRSLSFGLTLTCLGLIITMAFLLLLN